MRWPPWGNFNSLCWRIINLEIADVPSTTPFISMSNPESTSSSSKLCSVGAILLEQEQLTITSQPPNLFSICLDADSQSVELLMSNGFISKYSKCIQPSWMDTCFKSLNSLSVARTLCPLLKSDLVKYLPVPDAILKLRFGAKKNTKTYRHL